MVAASITSDDITFYKKGSTVDQKEKKSRPFPSILTPNRHRKKNSHSIEDLLFS